MFPSRRETTAPTENQEEAVEQDDLAHRGVCRRLARMKISGDPVSVSGPLGNKCVGLDGKLQIVTHLGLPRSIKRPERC